MKKILFLLSISVLLASCTGNSTKVNQKKINDSIHNAVKLKMEELMKPINMFSDTVGSNCPVEVYYAELFNTGDYNNSKGIHIKYRNISQKTITAISFSAYIVDAFNEPVDLMGVEEMLGIMTTKPTDEILKPGKSNSNKWTTRKNECRKILKINALKVAFSDGEIWDLSEIKMKQIKDMMQ